MKKLMIIGLMLLAGGVSWAMEPKPGKKPNIVFFLIDDLGYTDLGCYGSTFYETPNIDELAKRGTVFTQAYAASAVCSPTRATILTGKHPARLKITDWIGPDVWHVKGKMKTPAIQEFLPLEEVTLAETLKAQGYSTCFIGKWHLGKSEFYPDKQGFDHNIGGNDCGGPPMYFSPYTNPDFVKAGWDGYLPNIKPGPEGEYLTDRLTDEAINYLDTVGNRPFFLYLSHYAVHVPLRAKEELVKKYRAKAAGIRVKDLPEFVSDINRSLSRAVQNHEVYAAMVQSMDESVGRVLKKLDQMGVSDETIVVFTSDNGGLGNSNFQKDNYKFSAFDVPTSNSPFRTGKGWYYEGGIKVPAIVYLPGAISNGSTSAVPIFSADFYPTLLQLCGIPLQPQLHMDGESFAGIFEGKAGKLAGRALYWHYPHYHSNGETPTLAIRKGRYKLIQRYENQDFELYDIVADISEKKNLVKKLPRVKQDLLADLEHWKKSLQVDLPQF